MLVLMAVCLLAALSTGSVVLLMAALLILTAYALGLIAAFWTARTLRASLETDTARVTRGSPVTLRVRLRHGCLLPTAPPVLTVSTGPGSPPVQVTVPAGRRETGHQLSFTVDHVGVSSPGLTACSVRDVLGLTAVTREFPDIRTELVVLPSCFELTPLVFAPSDPGLGNAASATEDASDPMDVRPWQRGDSLKKVHWKLSARKRELMVRRFEEPTLPEALVLLDCTAPETGGLEGDAREAIRDSLLETAASIMNAQMQDKNEVRLPLQGDHPEELNLRMGMPLVLERLARVELNAAVPFAQQLLDASQRIRRYGAAVVITTRLDGQTTDLMVNLRRMGPTLRLYLVTHTPDRADWRRLISRLQEAGAEVIAVAPPR